MIENCQDGNIVCDQYAWICRKFVSQCAFFFLISRFPEGSLYTNTNDEGWRMIRVGDDPLGFGQFFFFFYSDLKWASENLVNKMLA